jgi:uncharacterized membrane protein
MTRRLLCAKMRWRTFRTWKTRTATIVGTFFLTIIVPIIVTLRRVIAGVGRVGMARMAIRMRRREEEEEERVRAVRGLFIWVVVMWQQDLGESEAAVSVEEVKMLLEEPRSLPITSMSFTM